MKEVRQPSITCLTGAPMDSLAHQIAEQIIAAFQRIRALLFTMSIGSALLLSNVYLDELSFTDAQLKLSYPLRDALSQAREHTTDPVERSALTFRIDRIDNTRRSQNKLHELNLPIVGLTMSANDAVIIIDIFLTALALWALYSVHQIRDALAEKEIKNSLPAVAPLIRSAAVFTYRAPATWFKRVMIYGMFMLPTLAVFIVLLIDIYSMVTYDRPEVLRSMSTVIFSRFLIEVISIVILAITTRALILNSHQLSEALYIVKTPDPAGASSLKS